MFEECETHTFPIDCFEIAEKLCYTVRSYSSLNTTELQEAYSISDDAFSRVEVHPITGMNIYVIYYNDLQFSAAHYRWSIFHEIGHIYLGHHDNPDDRFLEDEEAEANFFARYASAPCPLVYGTKCQNDYDVAERFYLSSPASHWAFVSFQNWLRYGPREILPYELTMMKQFHLAIAS